MTDPLVTIVTPAYNRVTYLEGVIQSVLEQDYPNIEYIVLDDGSKDNTREMLEKYTGRIVWESHPNMGKTRTNNKGWSMAHGDIIATVNSDDPLLPGAVRAAVEFMQAQPEVLVAYPDWNMIDHRSELIGHVTAPEYDYWYMLRRHHCIVGPGAFIRRKAFELTEMRDPAFKYAADFEYWLRLGLFGRFARIPQTLATLRFHPGSATVTEAGEIMAQEYIRLIDKIYALPDLPPDAKGIRSEAYGSAYYAAGVACGDAPSPLKKWYYRRALAYAPISFLTRYLGRLAVMLPTFLGRSYRHLKAENMKRFDYKRLVNRFKRRKPSTGG